MGRQTQKEAETTEVFFIRRNNEGEFNLRRYSRPKLDAMRCTREGANGKHICKYCGDEFDEPMNMCTKGGLTDSEMVIDDGDLEAMVIAVAEETLEIMSQFSSAFLGGKYIDSTAVVKRLEARAKEAIQ